MFLVGPMVMCGTIIQGRGDEEIGVFLGQLSVYLITISSH